MKTSLSFGAVGELLCGSARVRWHSSGQEQSVAAAWRGQGRAIGGVDSVGLLGVLKAA